jgi:hypothetical protein
MDGAAVLAGTPLAGGTVSVMFELAVETPSSLLAETTARSVRPESAETTVYVFCVAPEIGTHDDALEHRCHWYV